MHLFVEKQKFLQTYSSRIITFAAKIFNRLVMNKKTRIPNPIVALTPLAVLVALLAMVIPTFGATPCLAAVRCRCS